MADELIHELGVCAGHITGDPAGGSPDAFLLLHILGDSEGYLHNYRMFKHD